MATLDSDDLRALTGFKAVTWVDTSGNAKTTIEAASAGTLVRLGTGTHALGDNRIEIPDGVSVWGAGQSATRITSSYDSGEADECAVIKPGTGTWIKNLTVHCTLSDGTLQLPIGYLASQTQPDHCLIEDVETIGQTDGIYVYEGTSKFVCRRVLARSNWDCFVVSSGSQLIVEDSIGLAIGSSSVQCRTVNINGTGYFIGRRSHLLARNGTGGTDGNVGVQIGGPDVGGGRAELIDCSIRTESTLAIAGKVDLYTESGVSAGTCIVHNTSYDPAKVSGVTPIVIPSSTVHDVRKIVQSIRG
jgi:hypothetical protein